MAKEIFKFYFNSKFVPPTTANESGRKEHDICVLDEKTQTITKVGEDNLYDKIQESARATCLDAMITNFELGDNSALQKAITTSVGGAILQKIEDRFPDIDANLEFTKKAADLFGQLYSIIPKTTTEPTATTEPMATTEEVDNG